MTRRINAAGLALIKQWEGRKLLAYYDGGGVLTIGYGSTGKHVKPGMRISEAQAEKLLMDDLDRFERRVASLAKVPLNDNQFAALVSFDFNTGAIHKSTLLKKLNKGNYAAVPSELMKWVNDNGKRIDGLVNRRKAEVALWGSKAGSGNAPKVKPELTKQPGSKAAGGWLAAIINAIVAIFRGSK